MQRPGTSDSKLLFRRTIELVEEIPSGKKVEGVLKGQSRLGLSLDGLDLSHASVIPVHVL
jgi:hypothetical protein